jgi:hypothetical protein
MTAVSEVLASPIRERAIQAGFNDVVIKPVLDMDAFCRMIVEVADRKAA